MVNLGAFLAVGSEIPWVLFQHIKTLLSELVSLCSPISGVFLCTVCLCSPQWEYSAPWANSFSVLYPFCLCISHQNCLQQVRRWLVLSCGVTVLVLIYFGSNQCPSTFQSVALELAVLLGANRIFIAWLQCRRCHSLLTFVQDFIMLLSQLEFQSNTVLYIPTFWGVP